MEEVGKYIQRLQALAQGIATVDALQGPVVAENQHLILAQSLGKTLA